jgi:hypothetical protein
MDFKAFIDKTEAAMNAGDESRALRDRLNAVMLSFEFRHAPNIGANVLEYILWTEGRKAAQRRAPTCTLPGPVWRTPSSVFQEYIEKFICATYRGAWEITEVMHTAIASLVWFEMNRAVNEQGQDHLLYNANNAEYLRHKAVEWLKGAADRRAIYNKLDKRYADATRRDALRDKAEARRKVLQELALEAGAADVSEPDTQSHIGVDEGAAKPVQILPAWWHERQARLLADHGALQKRMQKQIETKRRAESGLGKRKE